MHIITISVPTLVSSSGISSVVMLAPMSIIVVMMLSIHTILLHRNVAT